MKNYRLIYGIYGTLIGLIFPIYSTVLESYRLFNWINIQNILFIQSSQPNSAIVNLVPVILGLAGTIIGKKYQELSDALEKLENDNTQNLEFQQDLRKEETASLYALIENTDSSIWSIDQNYKLLIFNSAFKEYYHKTYEEIPKIGDSVNQFFYLPQHRIWSNLYKRALSGEKFTIEIENPTDKGIEYLEISFNPVIVEEIVKSTTVYLKDISERKKIELNLYKEKEKAQTAANAKSEFLAIMSHEIRTPMNGVIGMTSLLIQTSLTEEQKDYVETIRVSGESLLTIINDILDFSKIDSGKMELEITEFNLRKSVEEIFDLLSVNTYEKSIDFFYYISNEIPEYIKGDVTRIKQVLVNLIGNAIKFTDKGEVSLYVDEYKEDKEDISLKFMINDTGIGISDEKIDKLFNPFSQVDSSTTRKYGGTGLGLAISKRLIELHGGLVWIESIEYKGTKFYFTLKLYKVNNQEEIVKINFAGKKVVLSENNQSQLTILENYFKDWNLNIFTVNNIFDINNNIPSNSVIDLAVIDLNIEDYENIINALRKNNETLPIIFLTNPGCTKKINIKEPTTYFPKPIKYSNLVEELRKVLDNKIPDKKDYKQVPKIDPKLYDNYPLKILLVEDNQINQKLALKIFEKMGYKADLASNGIEGVESVGRQHYDIVFMDLQMPEMDGITATKEIIKIYNERPVIIAMTANAMPEDRQKCIEAGMDDYISKPISIEKIQDMLIKWSEKTKVSR